MAARVSRRLCEPLGLEDPAHLSLVSCLGRGDSMSPLRRTYGECKVVRAFSDMPSALGLRVAEEPRTPDGFWIMFGEDWHPVTPVNRFMITTCYQPRRFEHWQDTQRAVARDLELWMAYVHARGLDWWSATPEDVYLYGERMAQSVSVTTGLQFSTSTVRRRQFSVESFYRWARKQRVVECKAVGFNVLSVGARGPGGYGAARASPYRRARGRDPEIDPRPMHMAHLNQILDRLGPAIFRCDQSLEDWQRGSPPRRNRLMAELALHGGLRCCEVASVKDSQVAERAARLNPHEKWELVKLKVRTKGRNTRDVLVPAPLIRAMMRYRDVERTEIVERAVAVASKVGRSYRSPEELFLNGLNCNDRDIGRPVNRETASRAFTAAVLAEGFSIMRQGFALDPETGDPLRDESGMPMKHGLAAAAYRFHDLRHTFAVMFYKSEVLRGNPEPWEKLKQRLGHAHSETTRNIYLRHIDASEAAISDMAAQHMRGRGDAYRV